MHSADNQLINKDSRHSLKLQDLTLQCNSPVCSFVDLTIIAIRF